MPDTTCHVSISLDGFVAGPGQSREDPWASLGRVTHQYQDAGLPRPDRESCR